jgi:hypothetical protein
MKAREDVSPREMLHLLPRLHEEAALRDAYHDPPPVTQPDEEARVARPPVDRQEVQVVVEAR